jgi:predicted transposase/invertase (TIGR01784 family)
MAEQTTNSGGIAGQSKLYDKIIKENIREVLPVLVKEILGINIISREDLPESLQHTRETVPDQLSKITDDKGETYILHIEWQSKDDPSMDHRMLNYRAMLRKKYGLTVKQYVIFLGSPKSTMPYIIDEENLKFNYNLISLRQYSHKLFLNSSLPEQKIMAIFGNFENERPVDVIKEILVGIEQEADGEINCQRYKEQLRALIQLRKLGKEFKIAMGIIEEFKKEKDPFYQDGVKIGREKGREEGIEKGREEGIEKGRHVEALEIAYEMKKDKFPVEKIAKLTKLSVEEIESL